MRILHLDTGRQMRGGQHQLLLLLRGLESIGHEQTLLARRPLLDHWHGQAIHSRHIRRASRQADIIHAHDARSHTLAALLCPGKPLIVSRRVAFPIRRGFSSKWKYARADAYLAVSEFVRQRMLAAGVDPAKLKVVYDGVAPALATPSRRARSEGAAPRVIAPRVDDPLKNAAVLEKACGLAGAELKFSNDLVRDLPEADLFVYLSECEGLGSAILLAMARDVPVIASRVGGIPELIEHEKTGLLVENEAGSVAAAIRRMAEDREFAQRCAENACAKAGKEFADDIMVRQTNQVYRAILGLGPAP